MDELEAVIGQSLSLALQSVLEGASADIARYARSLSTDLVQVMQEPNPDTRAALQVALQDQVKMLAELSRVRANAAAWQIANNIIDAVFTVGFTALGIPPVPQEG